MSVSHILDFKRDLTIVLIAHLFILLAARLQPTDTRELTLAMALFLAVLIVVIRPICGWLSKIGSRLRLAEWLYLGMIAPRGIVAAAVASVFGLRLAEGGYEQAERLAPVMFMVIVGTVTIYGLAATPLARWLKLADPDPQGVLILGAHDWARRIAKALAADKFTVLLLDTNRENVSAARLDGLDAELENILAPDTLDELELAGLGRLLALTSNDEVNSLAAIQAKEVFNRSELYQLAPSSRSSTERKAAIRAARGRLLFHSDATFHSLAQRFAAGALIKKTRLTAEFTFAAYCAQYGESALPLFIIEDRRLRIVTADMQLNLRAGQVIVALVDADAAEADG